MGSEERKTYIQTDIHIDKQTDRQTNNMNARTMNNAKTNNKVYHQNKKMMVISRRPRPVACHSNAKGRVSRTSQEVRLNAEKLSAAMIVGAGAALASPLTPAAEAATVTPSLRNLLYSVLAGASVLGAIAGAVTFVSTFDRLDREKN